MTRLTRPEKETILRWSEDPEEGLTIYTHDSRKVKQLLAAGATLKRTSRLEGVEVSWTLEAPRGWARWPRKPRVASPGAVENLRRAREAKMGLNNSGGKEAKLPS